jgi:hypothetical protein
MSGLFYPDIRLFCPEAKEVIFGLEAAPGAAKRQFLACNEFRRNRTGTCAHDPNYEGQREGV